MWTLLFIYLFTYLLIYLLIYLFIYLFIIYLFFPTAPQPLVDQARLLVEASASHSGTSHLVGHLWTSDQPVVETATW